MSANMYRVGDYVFFETSSTAPYQIRRIEELNKTQNGNVEAKVMCFYRRRDISNSLIVLADKHHNALDDECDEKKELNGSPSPTEESERNGGSPEQKTQTPETTEENGKAPDDNKAVIDSTKAVSDSTKAVSDSTKAVSDSTKAVSDSTKTISDSTKTISDSTKTVSDSTKTVSDSTKTVSDSTKTVSESIKAVSDSAKAVGDSTKAVSDSTKADSDSSKTVSDSTKAVSDNTKAVSDSTKAVSDSTTDSTTATTTSTDTNTNTTTPPPPLPTTTTITTTTSNNNNNNNENNNSGNRGLEEIPEKLRHQLKHRELFLSRQVETLPATHIRGKCCVTLLNETESLLSYLNKDDTFFYSLVYDPQQKTLLADKGEIRVGSKFQADMIPTTRDSRDDDRVSEDLEELVWDPYHKLDEKEIDQFQIVARSVGTFARALDCTSTVRQPSLHMSAAAASRDITIFHAMDTLHIHHYDLAKAIKSLVPSGGPVLCRDEMEEWSASEANLFEDAIEKYGKDFNDIRQDFLPWKSLKSIVEYYYMWKTTDRYVQQKRIKASEAESKLKQVYIPNYNKPNPAAISNKINGVDGSVTGRACESCYSAQATQWYSWGPVHLQCRLCNLCWSYWKKYGGLKMPTRLDGERPAPNQRHERVAQMNSIRMQRCTIAGCGKEFKLKAHLARHLATAHGLTIQPGSPRPVMKTRAAFCLVTTELTRISRRLCSDILRPRHAARCPFTPINTSIIKQECQMRLSEHGNAYQLPAKCGKNGRTLDPVVARLGIDIKQEKPSILHRGPHPGAGDSSNKNNSPQESVKVTAGHPSIMKKRGYEQTNGVDSGPPIKRPNMGVVRQAGGNTKMPGMRPMHVNSLNGRSRFASRGMKMHMVSWMDMPDDVYFVATSATRKIRKQLQIPEFKRLARNPWKKLNIKPPMPSNAISSSNGHGTNLPQEVVVLD